MEHSLSSAAPNSYIPFDDSDMFIQSDGGARSLHLKCAMTSHDREARLCCLPCGELMCELCVVSGIHASHGTPVLVENAVAEILHRAVPLVETLKTRQPLFDLYKERSARQQQTYSTTKKQVNDYFDTIAAAVEAQRAAALANIAKAEQDVAKRMANLAAIVPMLEPARMESLTLTGDNTLGDVLTLFHKLHKTAQQANEGNYSSVPFVNFAPVQTREQIVEGVQAAVVEAQSIACFGDRYIYDLCWTGERSIAVVEINNKQVQEISITGEPMRIIPTKREVRNVAYHPTTGRLYVCEKGVKKIEVINKDRTSGTPIDCEQIPARVKITAQTHHVYYLSEMNELVRVSPPLNLKLSPQPAGYGAPCNFMIKSDSQVIFCNCNHHEVEVYSLSSLRCVFKFGLKGPGSQPHQFDHPRAAEVDPMTGNIIIADQRNKRLSVWKDDGTFVQVIPLPNYPTTLRVNPQNTHMVIGFESGIMIVTFPLLSSYVHQG